MEGRNFVDNIVGGLKTGFEGIFGGGEDAKSTSSFSSSFEISSPTAATTSDGITSADNNKTNDTVSSGMAQSTKIALGVSIPLAIILVSIIIWLIVKLRRKQRIEEDKNIPVQSEHDRTELIDNIGGSRQLDDHHTTLPPPQYSELPENTITRQVTVKK